MAAPTLVLQQLASALTSFSGSPSVATRAFAQVTVATGDRLAINIRTEDGWYHGTSVANAGTATVSAWTRVQSTGVVQASCGNDLFTATVTTGGTLTPTVTMTSTNGVATGRTGGTLAIATGATGTATAVSTTARQLSYLTTSPASAVFTFTADWTAAASSGATFTPSTFGQVIDIRATDGVDQKTTVGSNSSVFAAHWTDTGAAATTTFGLATPSAGTYTTTLLEFLGTATAVVARPRRIGKRR